jgi:Protein of unknown function (DUF732)
VKRPQLNPHYTQDEKGTTMRKMLAAATLAGVALATVATGTAHANPQDQQFFRALDRLGFVLYDPPLAITHGRMVCNEGLAHGVSWGEIPTSAVSGHTRAF